MMKKRGISPIIAAVILIAIVVAVGALVANFIRSYANTQQEGIDSSQAGIKCATDVSLSVVQDVTCTATEELSFTIQNGGVALSDLTVNVIGSGSDDPLSEAVSTDPDVIITTPSGADGSLADGAVMKLVVDATDLSQDPDRILIVPTIQIPGNEEDTTCAESGLEILASEMDLDATACGWT